MSGASIDPLLLSDIEQSIHWASLCFESDDINCDGVLHDLLQSQQLLELIKIQQNEEKYISLQSTLSVLIEQVSLRCESRRLKTITTTTTTTTTTSSSSSGVDTAPENEQGVYGAFGGADDRVDPSTRGVAEPYRVVGDLPCPPAVTRLTGLQGVRGNCRPIRPGLQALHNLLKPPGSRGPLEVQGAGGPHNVTRCIRATAQLKKTLPPIVVDIIEENLKGESRANIDATDPGTTSNNSTIEELKVPETWEKMDHRHMDGFLAYDVKADSEEYKTISERFYQTMEYPNVEIMQIQRIQNYHLWMFYCLKKKQMIQENFGRDVREMQLFHGTSSQFVDSIARDNFDWRLCGTHGTKFGKGSYFARDAKYSHEYTDYSNTSPHSGTFNLDMLSVRSPSHSINASPSQPIPSIGDIGKATGLEYLVNKQAVRNVIEEKAQLEATVQQNARQDPALMELINTRRKKSFYNSVIDNINTTTLQMSDRTVSLATGGVSVMTSTLTAPSVGSTSHQSASSGLLQTVIDLSTALAPSSTSLSSTSHGAPFIPTYASLNSMFLGRVLVGKFTEGDSSLRKPPPLDQLKPYGKSYDSCVDTTKIPHIYVIFDKSQCYPEYVLRYKVN